MFTGEMGMEVIKAFLLGIIHGITEILPVSSAGHMTIFSSAFRLNIYVGPYFEMLVHIGILTAVIISFHEDIWHMLQEFFNMLLIIFANAVIFFRRKRGNDEYTYIRIITSNYRKLNVMILVSLVPALVIGTTGRGFEAYAGSTLLLVGLCFIVNGVLMFISGSRSEKGRRIKDAGYSEAYYTGMVRGIAFIPGLSGTGSVISVSKLLGFNSKLAVKYSFILMIPVLTVRIICEAGSLKGEAFGSSALPGYILGMAVAGISAFFAVRYMMKIINMKKYKGFSIYCLAAGTLAVVFSIIR